jgi:hypothetical protein
MAKFSLKQMIVEEISRMTDIDGTAARISKLITLKVTIPKKVWILLGEVEDEEGSEVVAVFKRNPNKKQQKEALKRHILRIYEAKSDAELEEKTGGSMEGQISRYTPEEGGALSVASREIEP